MPVTEAEHTGSFEPCTKVPEYIEVNRFAIDRWVTLMKDGGVQEISCLLDIATGIGTMVKLFLEHWPASGLRVICLDKSAEALDLAAEDLRLPADRLTMVVSEAECLAIEPASVDVVIWGNGIHYLPENMHVSTLVGIRRVLKPGGWFFFNSTFYAGARTKETEPFYIGQVMEAMRILRGQKVPRQKDDTRAEASKYHPAEMYVEAAKMAGFKIVDVYEKMVNSSHEFWQALCGYHQYAAGALLGFPVVEAARALQTGVAISLRKHGFIDAAGVKYIPRPWLMVAAQA